MKVISLTPEPLLAMSQRMICEKHGATQHEVVQRSTRWCNAARGVATQHEVLRRSVRCYNAVQHDATQDTDEPTGESARSTRFRRREHNVLCPTRPVQRMMRDTPTIGRAARMDVTGGQGWSG